MMKFFMLAMLFLLSSSFASDKVQAVWFCESVDRELEYILVEDGRKSEYLLWKVRKNRKKQRTIIDELEFNTDYPEGNNVVYALQSPYREVVLEIDQDTSSGNLIDYNSSEIEIKLSCTKNTEVKI